MKGKLVISALAGLLFCLPSAAQFYLEGSEPASVRWSSVVAGPYEVIYPRGLDSLGRAYAAELARTARYVGSSAGTAPCSQLRKPLPVLLHTHTSVSNGMVTWTPRRMELITVPDAYDAIPTPWMQHLSVHESRHVAQMMIGESPEFRLWRILTGQVAAGAVSAIYGGPVFDEGDAVATETALTRSGRGRTADFLEYYRVSTEEGQRRDFWQWRYGSQRLYTPDYYRAGYILSSGMRSFLGVPDFTERFYGRIHEHHGYTFFNLQKTVREATGMKLRDAFDCILDSLDTAWRADEAARGPFMPSSQLSGKDRLFKEYSRLESAGSGFYAVRNGLVLPYELVWVSPDGGEKRISSFASGSSTLRKGGSGGRIYWSETSYDPRWEFRSWSDIRYIDPDGKKGTLTHRRKYFNPAPSDEDGRVAVCEYPAEGGSAVVILDGTEGTELERRSAPEGLQVTELAWAGGRLYAAALGDDGFGIYLTDGWKEVLPQYYVKLKQLWSRGSSLYFTCDLTGVNELYELRTEDNSVVRRSSTRTGAESFRLNETADTLYYTVLSAGGRMIHRTAVSELPSEPADFSRLPDFPMVEGLCQTEGGLDVMPGETEVEVSGPQNFSKLKNLFRVHSWAPFYINYDNIASLSFESVMSNAGLGATIFTQNTLGNAYGYAGYHAIVRNGSVRHSGHAQFTYTGLYPVIEASADFNNRDANRYVIKDNGKGSVSLKSEKTGKPLISGTLMTYIPLAWSRSGISYGFIPKLSLAVTNDSYEGQTMSRLTANVRAYAVQRTPPSMIYPRFGIGGEIGYSRRPWTDELLSPNMYEFVYAYLPGMMDSHSLRLSGLFQQMFDNGKFCEPYANIVPRGFGSGDSVTICKYPSQNKVSADYVMPFAPVDWSFAGPLAYIRNFELTLHGDLCWFSGLGSDKDGSLYSVGADLSVRLANLLWIPYDTRIGVSYNRNGGRSFESLFTSGLTAGRNSLSLIFSVSLP